MERNQLPALPEYVCHKKVRAARIAVVGLTPTDGSRMVDLTLELPDLSTLVFQVTVDFIKKHDPMPGWYLVQYEDGYCSASPGPVFESGYSRMPYMRPITMAMIERMGKEAQEIIGGTHLTVGAVPVDVQFSEAELAALDAYSGPPLRFNQVQTLKGMGDGTNGAIGDLEFPAGSEWKEPGRG